MPLNEFKESVHIGDAPTEDHSCQAINNNNSDYSDGDDDISIKIPMNKELLCAQNILRAGVQNYGESFDELYMLMKILFQN